MRKSVWIERLPGGYSVRYYQENGSKAREWFQEYTLAQKRKTELKASLLAKKQGQIDPTLRPLDGFYTYLASLSSTHRESTLVIKRDSLVEFLKPINTFSELTRHSIMKWAERLKTDDYSDSSVSIKLRDLRAYCRWAVKNKYMEEQPFYDVAIPESGKRKDKLEPHEIKLLFDNSDDRFKLYLTFLSLTGGRRNEILLAEKHHFDFERSTWTIPKENCKTKVERTIPLDNSIIEQLKNHTWLSNRLFEGWYETTPRWYLNKACKKAEFKKKVTPHMFRHSFASHWKGDPRQLMEWMGWKTWSMIKNYSHFHTENLRSEASKGISSSLNLTTTAK